MGSGKYNTKFKVLVYSQTKNTDTKEHEVTYTEGVTYWGVVVPLSAFEKLAFGVVDAQEKVQIKLRNYITITTFDRLKDLSTDKVYSISGINLASDETVVDAIWFRDMPGVTNG